jgi:hypothetical protein
VDGRYEHDEARYGPDPFASQPDPGVFGPACDAAMRRHIHGGRDEHRQGLRMGAQMGAAVGGLAAAAADEDRRYGMMAEELVREVLELRRRGGGPSISGAVSLSP